MITIQSFEFNPFNVNTYILYDETGDCAIIDPGCMNPDENARFSAFITHQKLRPVKLLNTHAHIDHIAGNKFVAETYNVNLEMHKSALRILRTSNAYTVAFGFDKVEPFEPTGFTEDGDIVNFGNSSIKVLYTPGHADGSICFYSEKDKFVIVGDVLFNESIGRTDFPTGNFDLLMQSIKTKLFVLPDDTIVYPGHGPATTIGHEKANNPFIM